VCDVMWWLQQQWQQQLAYCCLWLGGLARVPISAAVKLTSGGSQMQDAWVHACA
jgi:hypothetical protein